MRVRAIIGAALVCLAGCNPYVPDRIQRGMDERYYGYVDRGSKFGIEIGMSRAEARSILVAAGQNDPDERVCRETDRFVCEPGAVYDDYYWSANVPSERNRRISPSSEMKHGWIAVFVADDKVTAIGWSFFDHNIDL